MTDEIPLTATKVIKLFWLELKDGYIWVPLFLQLKFDKRRGKVFKFHFENSACQTSLYFIPSIFFMYKSGNVKRWIILHMVFAV